MLFREKIPNKLPRKTPKRPSVIFTSKSLELEFVGVFGGQGKLAGDKRHLAKARLPQVPGWAYQAAGHDHDDRDDNADGDDNMIWGHSVKPVMQR